MRISAKLTATWAKRYEDYPHAEEYSYLNGNLDTEEYQESIFVGYRYFDSFDKEPLFPFGFGLSYTNFELKYERIENVKNGISVSVKVTNTGTVYTGKEVVQIYASFPQGNVKREHHRLVGYAKTKALRPGETEVVQITVNQKELAYFSEKKHQWILEKGIYGIWVGNSSDLLKYVASVLIEKSAAIENTRILETTSQVTEDLWEMYKERECEDFEKTADSYGRRSGRYSFTATLRSGSKNRYCLWNWCSWCAGKWFSRRKGNT